MLGVLQIVRGSALRKSRDRIVRRGRGCERAAYRQRRRLGYSGIMDTHVALPHPDLSVLCSYLQKTISWLARQHFPREHSEKATHRTLGRWGLFGQVRPALSALAGSGNFNLLRRTPGKVSRAKREPYLAAFWICGIVLMRGS